MNRKIVHSQSQNQIWRSEITNGLRAPHTPENNTAVFHLLQRIQPIRRPFLLKYASLSSFGHGHSFPHFSTGRFKVFRSCRNWLEEFRIFGRDETCKIINEQKFHLMAATRCLFLEAMEKLEAAATEKTRPTRRMGNGPVGKL